VTILGHRNQAAHLTAASIQRRSNEHNHALSLQITANLTMVRFQVVSGSPFELNASAECISDIVVLAISL
jgi:hypothetical protein